MLQRPAVIDELQTILSDWVSSLNSMKLLGAYLFGSTVNDGGVRFQLDKGDLDIIIVANWESVSPGDRVAQINALRDAKLDLEGRLLRKLNRENASEQIVSLVPMTPFEVDQAVHKDGIKHILISAKAYDLFKKVDVADLQGGQSPSPLKDEHRSVLSFVQKKRAEALSVSPNGRGGLAPQAHDDPVPKELMRNFAVATADLGQDGDISDLARGLREISEFASASAGWTPLTTAFAKWLEVRQGVRGTVPSVINHDHYLLLIETMFDRVRQQYPASRTVRLVGPVAKVKLAPPTSPGIPSLDRMNALFRVTIADRLGGSKSEVLRAIRAGRANMRARVAEPFELVFDEETGAADLLETSDEALDDKAHRKKMKAFERRAVIAARQARWAQGVELILWYGGTLFQGRDDIIEEACRIAISNWFSIAATNLINPGGGFEAFHTELYPSQGMAFSFSASTLSGKDLTSLEPNNLAGSFVPNLVSKYLHLTSNIERIRLRENRDQVFDISFWDYGLK